MPPLIDQMKALAAGGGLNAGFYVARILTPLGLSYADAVKRGEPYDCIVGELPEMRRDVIRLAHRALDKNADAYILINNRAEGCAPLTIDALTVMLSEELPEC